MRASMICNTLRLVVEPISAVRDAPAEIDIFKPEWLERFVESLNFVPHGTAHHKERTRGLFDGRADPIVEIECTIAAIGGIVRPETI